MSDLRNKLIRLAYRKPELRRDLLPLLKTAVDMAWKPKLSFKIDPSDLKDLPPNTPVWYEREDFESGDRSIYMDVTTAKNLMGVRFSHGEMLFIRTVVAEKLGLTPKRPRKNYVPREHQKEWDSEKHMWEM